jgi:hypothetical protein
VYDDPAGCPMGDLDLLIERRHVHEADRVMEAMGYRWATRSPLGEKDLTEAIDSGGAEYVQDIAPDITLWIEMQWRAVGGRWMRPDKEPDADVLLSRSVPIAGSAVRLLSPEDNLLQVSIHTAKHSYVRAPGFRLHTDVDRLVRRIDIDWREFVRRVRALEVATAVYFSLKIAVDLLGTPVPQDVLSSLEPSAWRKWAIAKMLKRAGLFHPLAAKWSRFSYILFCSLLYDSFHSLWRAAFPAPSWMTARYGIRRSWLLPLSYGRRLWDLLLNRANT